MPWILSAANRACYADEQQGMSDGLIIGVVGRLKGIDENGNTKRRCFRLPPNLSAAWSARLTMLRIQDDWVPLTMRSITVNVVKSKGSVNQAPWRSTSRWETPMIGWSRGIRTLNCSSMLHSADRTTSIDWMYRTNSEVTLIYRYNCSHSNRYLTHEFE